MQLAVSGAGTGIGFMLVKLTCELVRNRRIPSNAKGAKTASAPAGATGDTLIPENVLVAREAPTPIFTKLAQSPYP